MDKNNELSKLKWLMIGSMVLQVIFAFLIVAWITFMMID